MASLLCTDFSLSQQGGQAEDEGPATGGKANQPALPNGHYHSPTTKYFPYRLCRWLIVMESRIEAARESDKLYSPVQLDFHICDTKYT